MASRRLAPRCSSRSSSLNLLGLFTRGPSAAGSARGFALGASGQLPQLSAPQTRWHPGPCLGWLGCSAQGTRCRDAHESPTSLSFETSERAAASSGRRNRGPALPMNVSRAKRWYEHVCTEHAVLAPWVPLPATRQKQWDLVLCSPAVIPIRQRRHLCLETTRRRVHHGVSAEAV